MINSIENNKCNDKIITDKEEKSEEGTINIDKDSGRFQAIITSMSNEHNGNDKNKSELSQDCSEKMYREEAMIDSKVCGKIKSSVISKNISDDDRNSKNDDVFNEVTVCGEISCSTIISNCNIDKIKMEKDVFMLNYLFANILDEEKRKYSYFYCKKDKLAWELTAFIARLHTLRGKKNV